jgi:hypothetical protein
VKKRSIATALAVAVVGTLALAGSAFAQPTWAPAGSAPVHPGVQTYTQGGQCTSNFVFFDAANTVYIGQAAHCSGTDGNTATNGCEAGTLPVGTPVEVVGASRPGTMVYNSWATMQANGETNADACEYNDFALIRLDPADFAKVNPSVPYWGGPTGLGGATAELEDVFSYGNSSLRLGITQTSPKKGKSLGTTGAGWSHLVYTITPGIPGDSGSGFLDSAGRAFGTLSTVAVAPLPASNGVGDLRHELDYMRANSSFSGVQLANGTQAFNGNKLPVGG